MTQDEIIEMAQECRLIGMRPHLDGIYSEALVAFANLAAEKALAEHAMRETQRLGQEIEQERIDIHSAQPEQERFLIATIGNWGRVEWADGVFPSLGDKMYSAPRTWVGLTDEEIWETISRIGTSDSNVNPYAKLADARAIESKLRSKNT